MNKIYLLAMSLLLLVSCGNRRPGMSREDAAAELKEQAAQEEAQRQERAARVDTFAADYRPPAGIKYQAKIVTAGAKTIDVAAALKNVRTLKPNELGTPVLYATGAEAHPTRSPLLKVEGEWVMQALEGLYLLDGSFRAVRQLFRNDMTIKPFGDNGYYIDSKRSLGAAGYDAPLRQLRALYTTNDGQDYQDYIATLPWDELRAAADTCTPDWLVSLLPLPKGRKRIYAMEGGFFGTVPFSSRVCTFGVKGDTLCRFRVNDAGDYEPTGTYRGGEGNGNVYMYQGKPRLRLAYDDTVYELADASTLKAVWRLDFGALKRPTGKYVVGSLSNDLSGYWMIDSFVETGPYVFLRLSEGHDCPANRSSGKVKLYTIIYNKQTGEGFSLPPGKDDEGHPIYPNIPLVYEGKTFPGFFPMGDADGAMYTVSNGKKMKKFLPDAPSVQALQDKELVFIMIK